MKNPKKSNRVSARKKFLTIKRRKSIVVFKPTINVNTFKNIGSYLPTINKQLISLHDREMDMVPSCNYKQAFRGEPIQYKVNGKCLSYTNKKVKQLLLQKIQAFHVNTERVAAPKQIDSNCWFNSMFMMFFVSDKGRIFFLFFRQLMVEGYSSNHIEFPEKIQRGFALLNFIIESCLSGASFASTLNTNKVIHSLYTAIKTPSEKPRLYNVSEAGHPIVYYKTLMNYIRSSDINIMTINSDSHDWKKNLIDNKTYPHIIALQTPPQSNFHQIHSVKPINFHIDKYKYVLDSGCIIDNDGEHFCAVLTINGEEFVFDGYSKSRLIPFKWKHRLNENDNWNFKDYAYEFETETVWNFTKGYSCLLYYKT
jgi:hypothetical protein